MVRDDEFDFTGPGLAEIFNEKNRILVYRFSLEIEKARSMFGRHNSRTNDGDQMDGDEGGEGNNKRQRNQNVTPPDFPKNNGI